MRRSLLNRLEKLETSMAAQERQKSPGIRIGVSPPPLAGWSGETHIIVAKELPNGWCEFERRRGSAPPGLHDDGVPRIILTEHEALF